MKIVSVNVGLPREVIWKGKKVTTGIFKEPVTGRVMVRRLNLDGDRQGDLSVHGGPSKAVYVYPVEHYDYWRGELPEMKLPWGMFGENLTTEGLQEDTVNIGDRLRIGSAEVMVTEPRMPCYKLGIKFGREDIIKRFLRSGRTGFYVAVVEEGEVGAGDIIDLISRDGSDVTVADITRLYVSEKDNLSLLRRAMGVEALPESWREYSRRQIEKLGRSVEPEVPSPVPPCCE
jgi:MOSC domain-containing protein YiiM